MQYLVSLKCLSEQCEQHRLRSRSPSLEDFPSACTASALWETTCSYYAHPRSHTKIVHTQNPISCVDATLFSHDH
eukprot:3975040-Amphidinium_carterae.1